MNAPGLESYRIVRTLGAGAAGEVYLVENLAMGRLEALKILKKVEQNQADLVAQGRFKREVRAAQMVAHQNIVATYEAGQLPDGRLFMTMEYVEGTSLHALLQQRGPLPIPMVCGVLAEAADAIHCAHAAGVVHRDIKPHNIILADHPNGQIVRILDFGMAKIMGETTNKDGMVLSADGAIFGTPQYMSPEQCRGAAPDPRTDIYALGCVAFELLLGETPFRGALAIMFAAHLKKAPRVPSQVDPDAGIPRELDAIILRCLEKAPENRFQTGGDLCAALQGVPGYRPLRVLQPRG